MANEPSAEQAQPVVGSLDLSAAFVTAQFSAVLVQPLFVVLPVGCNQLDAPPFPSFPQQVGVVASVGDHSLRLLPRTAFGPWDADFSERGFRKRSFSRRGTFKPNSQPKTLTVDQYHPPRALATLGFADGRGPLFGRREAAVQKGFIPFQEPFLIQRTEQRAPRIEPYALLLPPLQSSPAGRGRGRFVGQKSPRCARLQNPQYALQTRPIGAGGRPRFSRRRVGLGSNGSIKVHSSSVNSFCRFFMPEAQQPIRLM